MKLSKIVHFSSLVAFFSIFFWSCGSSNSHTPRVKYKPEVADLKANVEIIRFEQDLLALDTANISEAVEKLKEKHGDFAKTFLVSILCEGRNIDVNQVLKGFLTIPEVRQLCDTIRQAYPDLNKEKADIEEMLKYKQHYFGDKVYPINKVYTFLSLYKFGAFALDNYAGLGLDFFLGQNHIGYAGNEILRHQYKSRTLNREHLVATLAAAIANDIVEENSKMGGNKMIDYMLFEGKKFFVKASLLPNAPDSIIYNFTGYQTLYCELGEPGLWEHIGKEKLIFSSRYNDFRKYVMEGPFNPQIDLPGNSGSWLGTQIVMQTAARMRKELRTANASMPIREIDRKVMQQILRETDAQKFIQKYRPTK